MSSVCFTKGIKQMLCRRYILPAVVAVGICFNAHSAEMDYLTEMDDFAVESKIYYITDSTGNKQPLIVLPPIFCFAKQKFKNEKAKRKYYEQYYRMIYNLKKVYPYSQIVKKKLAEMDAEFVKLKTKKERKAYIKTVEKQLFAEFEPHIRQMTISQGKMLIKLVNRETGRTGYAIIKELKGSLSAFFWQTIATIFSSSLKMEFDAENDDKVLNELIFLYENGML